MADRFDDIPGLVCYFSGDPTESTIVKAGDVITSVDSAYGSQAIQLTQLTVGSDNILHDGTTMVGEVPAFLGPTPNGDSGLIGTLTESYQPGDTPGNTIAVLEQRLTTVGQYSVVMTDASGVTNAGITGASGNYVARLNNLNKEMTPATAINLNPTIVILQHSNVGADTKMWVDGVEGTNATTPGNPPLEKICLMNRPTGGAGVGELNLAICVVYNRLLDAGEITELNTLLAYWRDWGEAPGGTGPSATFGPVSTNDDPSVTGWQWEESPNGTDWENVGTILTDISGATTTTLTVNSAPIEADQTRVRCKAFSAKEPAPDGVVSHTAILTVQP